MTGLSKILIDLMNLKMFNSIESVKHNSISKDHIGYIEVNFQNEIIRVNVFTFDDEFSVSKRIIEKSSLK